MTQAAAAAGAQGDTKAPGDEGKAAAAVAAGAGESKPGEEGKAAAAAGAAAADTGGKAGAGKETPKAPDKYALKVPDSGAEYIGDEDLKYIEQVARESDWTNDEAQAEIDAAVTRASAREKAQAAKYLEEFKADADYGGDKLEATQKLTKKAIDRIFPVGHRLRDRFLKTMNREVYGNNLVLAAALAEVGRLMGEDSPTQGRSSSGGSGDAASKLYDHPTSKAANA
jgi:hypothetical protein